MPIPRINSEMRSLALVKVQLLLEQFFQLDNCTVKDVHKKELNYQHCFLKQLKKLCIAIDEVAPTQTNQAPVAQSSTLGAITEATGATALQLRPFFNLNYNDGCGFRGFGSFGGFLPMSKTPGQNVIFLDDRVSVDSTGKLSGGWWLQAGNRFMLNASRSCI